MSECPTRDYHRKLRPCVLSDENLSSRDERSSGAHSGKRHQVGDTLRSSLLFHQILKIDEECLTLYYLVLEVTNVPRMEMLKKIKALFMKKGKREIGKNEIVYMPYEWFGITDDVPLRELNLPTCANCGHPIVDLWDDDISEEEKEIRLKTLHEVLQKHGLEPPECYEDYFILTDGNENDELIHEYCAT